MKDFNAILRSAITENYGVWKPCPKEWRVRCNLCTELLEEPRWCEIVMGRAIEGICPKHGKVQYSVE